MSRPAAYLWMIAILAVVGVGDFLVLTSSENLSRVARVELQKSFGEDLKYRDIRMSLADRVLVLDDVALYSTPARLKVLSAPRAEIRLKGATNPQPERLILESPRISLTDDLFTELAKMPPGPPLRKKVGPEGIPRIECRGGTLEFFHRSFFHWDSPQAFAIRELALAPVGSYRYVVGGRLSNAIFGEWNLHGDLDLETESTRLLFECDEVRLGPKIRHVLSPAIHGDWDRYRPEGPVAVRIEYVKEGGREAEFKVTARLKGASLTYAGFPYPVSQVEGEIDFFTNGFQIKTLQARRGQTLIRFDGRSSGYAAESDFKFRLDISDMPLDPALYAALDAGAKQVWDEFNPRGTIDATGWIVREYGPNKPVSSPIRIQFRDTYMNFHDFPYPLQNLSGEIEIDSPRVRIKGVEAYESRFKIMPFLGIIPERTRFLIQGTLDQITSGKRAVLDLHLQAFDLPVDARLHDALDFKTKKVWEEFRPQGRMDLDWYVTKDAEEDEPVHRGVARLHHCRALYKEVPLWVTDITGEVVLDRSGRVEFRHVQGVCSDARVSLDGALSHEVLDLRLGVVGLPLDPEVRKAMPKPVRDILDTLKLEGTVSVEMQLAVPRGEPKERETRVLVAMKMPRGRINTDIKIENIEQAQANLEVFVGPKGTELRGPVRIGRARIEGKEISDVSCSLLKTGSVLRFVHLQGTGYGGTVTGTFKIDVDTKEFEGEFAADRLDLYEYTSDSEKVKKGLRDPLQGKAMLELRNLRGKGGDSSTITGTGKLVITDAKLFPIPAVASIMRLDIMGWGSEQVISAATVHFAIRDRKFACSSVTMQGAGVSILGKGSVDFDGNIDFKLKMQSGGLLGIEFILFQIPVRLLDLLRDSLLPIRVTGTLEEPKINER